ncbi:MAG: alpha-ketoacid dehydrogenase subunit beta [Anaerolineae bacterium]|nr:alpha-ketoacid dehydrogenase subunit beta [Anaerolineae bacterium]MEB2287689.1 alpha-ketoacid dehydrogenase subunit beta [Anaerolineae bacterium]
MADRPITYREALSSALREEMQRDERVFIMGEEVGVWGGTYAVTRGFLDEFGARRVRDTPISEMVIAGAAVGAAMAGLRPIAEIMTINFAFLALDAIINHAAKVRYMFNGQFTVPLVIRTTTGGGKQLGATHSHAPEVIFAHFPGLYVAVPGTAYDAKGMLKASIRDDNPVLFVEHSTMLQRRSPVPDDPDFLLPIGKSDIKRKGSDVTIVTYQKGLEHSLVAAEELAKEGIEAEIVDLRWLRPLDLEPVFESFKKTNRCVVVEESLPMFNVGAEVAAQIHDVCFDWMDAPVKRVAAMDIPLPYSHEIELMALPSPEKIIRAVKEVV